MCIAAEGAMHSTLQATAPYILASEQLKRVGTPTLQLVNRPQCCQAATLLGSGMELSLGARLLWLAYRQPACL